jgi:hypothetical protein
LGLRRLLRGDALHGSLAESASRRRSTGGAPADLDEGQREESNERVMFALVVLLLYYFFILCTPLLFLHCFF